MATQLVISAFLKVEVKFHLEVYLSIIIYKFTVHSSSIRPVLQHNIPKTWLFFILQKQAKQNIIKLIKQRVKLGQIDRNSQGLSDQIDIVCKQNNYIFFYTNQAFFLLIHFMRSERLSLNQKMNNMASVGQYKIRRIKVLKPKLNLKQIVCEDIRGPRIDNNYNPFTINPCHLPEYRKQQIMDRVRISPSRQQKKIIHQDVRSQHKSDTRIPSISQSIKKIEDFTQSNLTLRQNPQLSNQKIIQRAYRNQTKTKKCSCGNCQQCMKDFGYYLHLCSHERGVPQISAKSWCIWRQKDDKFYYYYGKRIHKVRQIASLTKIITAMVLLDYSYKYNFDINITKFAVRKSSSIIGGTTAKLNIGQVYTLTQLLYGMMLPSGNDAAIAISEAVSLMISLKDKNKQFQPHSQNWFQDYQNRSYAYLFIQAMNQKVQRLGTIHTKIYNSHGNDAYDQLKNISTCNQIAKISGQLMKYPLLRQVAKTIQFTFGNGNIVQNTNKLLQDGFQGIKTGITQTAGPCLAAYYKDLIVVVLNSKSMNQRWFQVKKLVKWIKNRL